ncbi:CoxG family protein [Actinacidiphila sp. ITFR-21]|uniref:CoxG family protein n=1 Tax=Actinacidiphila sp. ITFR-21 TaxID=3075199 RepID=UPI00288A8030|nr:SRPBCC domain-containing protein [Streptomyces sp. ITFR-21]WNI16874.1 SRPBCC domain-containing protein [Streptomyces sp. ITFR-21]
MEHESFVPIPPARLLAALCAPAVIAASLPGWQPDEGGDGTGALTGRLRLRVGGSTITYRGTVGVTGDGPAFTVVAEGTEVRGGGTVKATARVGVAETGRPRPGTALVWQGSARADGRLAGYGEAVVEAAVRRLLDRFAAELGLRAPAADQGPAAAQPGPGADEAGAAAAEVAVVEAGAPSGAESGPAAEGGHEPAVAGEDGLAAAGDHGLGTAGTAAAPGSAAPGSAAPGPAAPGRAAAEDTAAESAAAENLPADNGAADSVPAETADVPEEPALEPGAERPDALGARDFAEVGEPDVVDDLGEPLPGAGLDDFGLVEVEVEVPESAAALDDLVPPAEAAHARRTMIGRSAEEVDHAPPRGRYAPVPAPNSGTATATLRWAAPAAAALLASAVVVGRVLRRRR